LKKLSNIIALCLLVPASIGWTAQPTAVTIQGDAQTSSLILPTTPPNSTTTLGSANIRLKIALGPEVKLQCGILGDAPLGLDVSFTHIVTCDDSSIFVLGSHLVISPTSVCSDPTLGIVGTFHEDASLSAAAGPYKNATGHVTIDGTTNCGFNKMTIAGTLTTH
jgi:hypothetical protein